MNEGVELILKRMDSHPDEFVDEWATGDYATKNRWQNVLYQVRSRMQEMGKVDLGNEPRALINAPYPAYLPFLSDADCEAIYVKHVTLQEQAFNKFCVAVVCGVEQPDTTDEYDTVAGANYGIASQALRSAKVYTGGVG